MNGTFIDPAQSRDRELFLVDSGIGSSSLKEIEYRGIGLSRAVGDDICSLTRFGLLEIVCSRFWCLDEDLIKPQWG